MIKGYCIRIFYLIIIFQCLSVYTGRASQKTNIGDGNEVSSYSDKGLDGSKNAWWYGGIAKEKYESKEYKEAILDFTNAILIDPEVPEFYFYRGNAYTFTKEPLKAGEDYKKALELDPDYLAAINNLGWEYLKKREYLSAIRYFFNYLKLLPKETKVLAGININSEYLNMLNRLGWNSLHENDLPKAIRYFTNYLKLAKKDPDAYLGLALIYYKYNDLEKATFYTNEAKSIEPSLYKGIAGLYTLEKSKYTYTDKDKAILMELFAEVGNIEYDLKEISISSAWKLLFGSLYIILGIVAFFIFAIRIKRLEGYIFYLGILNMSFGIKFLYDNPLIKLTELPSPVFWQYSIPFISFLIPIIFILFIRFFIGWGWKKSILWLLLYSILQGIVKIVAGYLDPVQALYGTTNTIFGFMAVIVLFFNLFMPEMRKNKEVQIISLGLGFYLMAIFYENLVVFQWLPSNLSFDEAAYLFFNFCLIFVAFSRIKNTEEEFLVVKQDLETARNIQNGILPEESPRSKEFEVSSAYLPMTQIGGDYYDYQDADKAHIGVLIADVSGHGISAALIASMLKVAFASQTINAQKPAVMLHQMNLSLTGKLNNEFITAGYMGVNLTTKKLTYSSAGHPPIILLRRETNEIQEITVKGIPIGVFEETKFKETTKQLNSGDRIILYTDGITDVFNLTGEPFGKKRFIELIKDSKNLLVEDANENILSAIRKWSGKKDSESYDDDITLMVFDIL